MGQLRYPALSRVYPLLMLLSFVHWLTWNKLPHGEIIKLHTFYSIVCLCTCVFVFALLPPSSLSTNQFVTLSGVVRPISGSEDTSEKMKYLNRRGIHFPACTQLLKKSWFVNLLVGADFCTYRVCGVIYRTLCTSGWTRAPLQFLMPPLMPSKWAESSSSAMTRAQHLFSFAAIPHQAWE